MYGKKIGDIKKTLVGAWKNYARWDGRLTIFLRRLKHCFRRLNLYQYTNSAVFWSIVLVTFYLSIVSIENYKKIFCVSSKLYGLYNCHQSSGNIQKWRNGQRKERVGSLIHLVNYIPRGEWILWYSYVTAGTKYMFVQEIAYHLLCVRGSKEKIYR